ncbi:MAG TPA: redox-sensing transcriptional repressor Rex [Dehalococcoidia bacterium]|nr:redox-sensing transcriptional repressor Rex [Dehalococcoidia bacterium]
MQNNNSRTRIEVPKVVVQRLPIYVRVLSQLLESKKQVISSQQLGELLQMTPAQIRKDLSYFGRFGKQGRGYNIQFLLDELRQILGIDRAWKACIVGLGRLGRAIINYPGFSPEGFEIVAAFDNDMAQYNSKLGNISVQSMEEIARTVKEKNISIGIVAVPSNQAQSVIDILVDNGITGILNYAPIAPFAPTNVVMKNIDPVLSLQSMTFYMK